MQKSHVLGASALATFLVSTAGWAQVTPEQVWQNWRDLSTSYGQTLSTTGESRAGDTLTVSGVAISMADEEVTVEAMIDEIAFRDRGDGTVEVTLSEQMPVSMTTATPDGAPFVMNILLEQPGLVLVASALPAETRYDVNAPTMRMTVTAPPTATEPADVSAVIDLVALTGSYTVATTELSRITSDLAADSLMLTMRASDPDTDTGGTFDLTATLTGLAGKTAGTMLPADQMGDVAAALAAGFASEGSMTYTGAEFSTGMADASGQTTAGGTFGPGSLTFALDKDRMAYGGTASQAEVRVSGAAVPFPELVISYAETAFDFLLPVAKSEEPEDFRALTRIVDLVVSDEVWSLFDPQAVLPRDPATLVIDLDGKARWLLDMFGPEAETMESVPGELHALTINDLTLRAAGASVSGAGAFTFDNSDLTTFDGMPAPTGMLDLTIVGANALLDRLSQSGLLPPDQVMGARMMMGLFARPGEGGDTLTSKVEFRNKGLFVNGQQLQ